jgi:hypothetical protein
MTSALDLDIATGGSFAYKTVMEGKKILDRILQKHTSSIVVSKTLHEKPMSCFEESSSAESNFVSSLLIDSSVKPVGYFNDCKSESASARISL